MSFHCLDPLPLRRDRRQSMVSCGASVVILWMLAGALLCAAPFSPWMDVSPTYLAVADSTPVARVQGSSDSPSTEEQPNSRVLRVAADPNNLPFSNSRLEGFENRIVALIARELGAKVEYTWTPQRRGFFRQTMKEGSCDLVAGVPKGFERTLTTAPYYKSTYVFLTRSDRNLDLHSFDDPQLRTLQIGVQMVGDDFANTPPAQALSERGIINNVHGYTVYGDYSEEAPLGRIVDAVARGEVDVAIVWGPLAGYYAKRCAGVFALAPINPQESNSVQPVTFDICMGVRRSEPELRDELDMVITRKRSEIEAILNEYGVPLADASH